MKTQHILSSTILTALVTGTTNLVAKPLVTDYGTATSAYKDAYLTGYFNLDSGNQAQTSYDLDLTVDYEKVFTSADRNTKLEFLGEVSRSRGSGSTDKAVSKYQVFGTTATVDNYFQADSNGSFWYGKAEVGSKKGQDDLFSKVTIGIGYGRVTNVTPMARAIRVIEELRKRGNLTSEPKDSSYQTVAKIIAKEDEYRSKYGAEDYEQYWVVAIEKALQDSGTVKDGGNLGTMAILKSYDILVNERIFTRKYGWLVRAGVGAVLTDYNGESGKPALEVNAEYHLPLSNATQFSNKANLIATLKDDNDNYDFKNTMSLTHELSDRIDWENKWVLNYNSFSASNDITSNALSSTFRYYLTNQLDFNTTVKLKSIDDNIDDNGNDDLDKSLFIGITYRLK